MFYQRRTDTTFGNAVVGRKELEFRQRVHREKVQRMTSSIDTRPPAAQPHLTLYGRDYVAKKRATTEAAFHDLKMIQSIARTMTRKAELPERKGPVSLNSDSRKQEIYRVMHENHRLLNSLEALKPVVSTTDLLRQNQWRQRYIINASHSKRLSGEYDDDIGKIKTVDKAKMDGYRRSVDMRRSARFGSSQGSTSMPSLTMPASTPTEFDRSQQPRQRKPKDKGRDGTSSASRSGAKGQKDVTKASVRFDTTSEDDLPRRHPKTPHPKASEEIFYGVDRDDEDSNHQVERKPDSFSRPPFASADGTLAETMDEEAEPEQTLDISNLAAMGADGSLPLAESQEHEPEAVMYRADPSYQAEPMTLRRAVDEDAPHSNEQQQAEQDAMDWEEELLDGGGGAEPSSPGQRRNDAAGMSVEQRQATEEPEAWDEDEDEELLGQGASGQESSPVARRGNETGGLSNDEQQDQDFAHSPVGDGRIHDMTGMSAEQQEDTELRSAPKEDRGEAVGIGAGANNAQGEEFDPSHGADEYEDEFESRDGTGGLAASRKKESPESPKPTSTFESTYEDDDFEDGFEDEDEAGATNHAEDESGFEASNTFEIEASAGTGRIAMTAPKWWCRETLVAIGFCVSMFR
eukprot:CAMPEP_0117520020 /NCGR_PEP_ID=MMETSP0784-20121206/32956_1 /TAXON_ID=39447 /ORGANISM="" /LENGTH=631 /DNA_ID=CAMNT_0005316007 /DNA_START=72 /DNA_END=1965 /DNA_ORIENTATION=+